VSRQKNLRYFLDLNFLESFWEISSLAFKSIRGNQMKIPGLAI